MASHVSQCMAKACMCDTWQAMCVTHDMPCVNMHGSLPCLYKGLTWDVGRSKGELKISPWEQQGEEEGREGEGGGKEKRKGGKEMRKGGKERKKERRKEKKKGEEERKKKEEEEGVLRSEQPRKAKNPELCYKR